MHIFKSRDNNRILRNIILIISVLFPASYLITNIKLAYPDTVKKPGCDSGSLMDLVDEGDIETLKEKIRSGCSPNAGLENTGSTLLLRAVHYNDSDMTLFLMKSGADIKRKNKYGEDAFLLASFKGNLKIMELLLKAGADVNTYNNYNDRPLYMAAITGRINVIEYLISSGAEINYDNKGGETPLMAASKENKIAVAACLVKHGANVNAKMSSGLTALMKAVSSGSPEMVTLLLNSGANSLAKDDKGNTAKDYSVSFKLPVITGILQKAENKIQ